MLRKPRLQPAKRAAGTDADDNRVDFAVQLFKQLRCGGGAVRQRIGLVIKLINIETARNFLRQTLRIILVIGRMALVDV
ncbi:hypothetical protein D3C87_1804150 [compost metagenome]